MGSSAVSLCALFHLFCLLVALSVLPLLISELIISHRNHLKLCIHHSNNDA